MTDAITIDNTWSAVDVNSEHSLGRIRWRTNGVIGASIDAIRDTPGAGHNVDIAFSTNTGGSGTSTVERMRINYNGNVGIGTTSPSEKLDVVGDIIINDTSDPTLYMRRNDGTPVSAIMLDTSTDNIIIGATNMDELIFRDDSGEGMRLDGSGNVGIGTTSPAQKLDVNGDIALKGTSVFNLNSAALTIGDTAGTDSVTTLKLTTTGDSTTVYLDDDGNVGIGTTSPIGNLNINGVTGDAVAQDSVLNLTRTSSTGNVYSAKLRLVEGTSTTHGDLRFQVKTTASSAEDPSYYTDAIAIKGNTANVGIGTTSPSQKLDVAGANNTWATKFTSNNSASAYFVHGSGYGGYINAGTSASSSTYILELISNGSTRMYVRGDGNVGIGTTSPGYKLTVDNDDLNTNNPALYVKNPNSSTAAVIAEFVGDSDSIQIKNIGTGDYVIYNSQQSNGIALYDGTGGVEIHYNGATVLEADSSGGIKVTGQLSATGDVVAYSSDERLKENIKPIENAVDKIKQLKGVTFDWNEKSEELGFEPSTKTNDVGVIAQDVEAVFPQLVHLAPFDIGSDEDGNATSKSGEDYKTVNYARLTAVLIEAVKEQQQQIDELKAKLDGITK